MAKTTRQPKYRRATREESLRLMDGTVTGQGRACMALPDGNPDACRLSIVTATGEVERGPDGSQCYLAPWLLCGVFKL